MPTLCIKLSSIIRQVLFRKRSGFAPSDLPTNLFPLARHTIRLFDLGKRSQIEISSLSYSFWAAAPIGDEVLYNSDILSVCILNIQYVYYDIMI